MNQPAQMTKMERVELGQLIRKREKVMKSIAVERSAQLLAEFERQSAQVYTYDQDEVWKKATEIAEATVEQSNKQIAERCKELGIPPEFAPSLTFGWIERGQNAVASRRAELRRVAKSKIEALEAEACTRIERMSLQAQTEVIQNGLQSQAAKSFLNNMPTLDALMPTLKFEDIKRLADERHKKRGMF